MKVDPLSQVPITWDRVVLVRAATERYARL